MVVVVTGGAGFVGSHVVDELVARGHEVRVLDDLSTGRPDHLSPSAKLLVGSVTNEEQVTQAFVGAEVVFHLAARKAVQRSVEQPLETDWVNTHGSVTVLKAAVDAGVRRVVYSSSSSVYGGTAALPTPEDSPTNPRSPYAVSKLAGESYARVFSELYGLETVTLRYFNVYGPRQPLDGMYAAVIPRFVHAALEKRPAVIFGDGQQTRDFTHVHDVASATWLAGTAPAEAVSGRTFNVAAGSPISILEVLSVVRELFEWSCEPKFQPARPGDVYRSCADPTLVETVLGYAQWVPFREGLKSTVEWAREHPPGQD